MALGNKRLILQQNGIERQLTTAPANQTTGLTNGRATNWAPEVEFSPFRALILILLLNQPKLIDSALRKAIYPTGLFITCMPIPSNNRLF